MDRTRSPAVDDRPTVRAVEPAALDAVLPPVERDRGESRVMRRIDQQYLNTPFYQPVDCQFPQLHDRQSC